MDLLQKGLLKWAQSFVEQVTSKKRKKKCSCAATFFLHIFYIFFYILHIRRTVAWCRREKTGNLRSFLSSKCRLCYVPPFYFSASDGSLKNVSPSVSVMQCWWGNSWKYFRWYMCEYALMKQICFVSV